MDEAAIFFLPLAAPPQRESADEECEPCGRSHDIPREGGLYFYFASLTSANAFSAAAIVRSMSSSVWASERKSVSNCEGAR